MTKQITTTQTETMNIEPLYDLDACSSAINWAYDKPDFATAWQTCEHGEWLLWLAAMLHVDTHLIIEAASDCTRIAVGHLSVDTDTGHAAHEALAAAAYWAAGEPTDHGLHLATMHDIMQTVVDPYNEAKTQKSYTARYAVAAVEDLLLAVVDIDNWVLPIYDTDRTWGELAFQMNQVITKVAHCAASASGYDDKSESAIACRRAAKRQCADLVRNVITIDMMQPLWDKALKGGKS